MASSQKSSKALNIALWIAQVALALTFSWSGIVKLFQPIAQLSQMWPWAGDVPVALVRLVGIIDLLSVLGLILPALLRIIPKLTPITAIAIIIHMICASAFHIARGEASLIGANVVFAIVAAFIAWGRFWKVRISSRSEKWGMRSGE